MNTAGLILDAIILASAAWLMGRTVAAELRGWESALGFGLVALMLVVGTGTLLGAIGGLGLAGFLAVHGMLLVGLLASRGRRWREDWAAARTLPVELWRELAVTPAERAMVLLLGAVAAAFLVLATTAQPVVFDALTYRLSRVSHWLQEGRITPISTDDARLNYMPVAPDLVMAWLLTGTGAGFRLTALAQTLGGLLALGATIGLARLTGLNRLGTLVAAALVLGLPNVVPQFTSAYTDLFTTGALAAGYCLWLGALQRGRGSWLGGAAAGFALGAKGTVVYFAPGLIFATAVLAWRHRAGLAAWVRTVAGGALAVAIFVLPLFVRNYQTYGHPIGPPDFIAWHEGTSSAEKLRLNLASAFVQLCEPNSQPPWWRRPVAHLGESVMHGLPETDSYEFNDIHRRANLEKVYALTAPDADVTSTGLLLPALALVAVAVAWRRRREPAAALVLTWAVALAALVVFLHWRLQWHPYLFRFLVLGAPWLAVIVTWWLQTLVRRWGPMVWFVVGVTTLHGFVAGMTDTYQSGWPATMHPEQSTGYHVFAQMRGLAQTLDRPSEPVRPALAVNAPLAAFYRLEVSRRVVPERLSALQGRRAEDAVRAGEGWLIVPVAEFLGREGRVLGRVSLFAGDESHPFSVVAWRALQPGESPEPLLYRNRVVPHKGGLRRELLVRGWDNKPVRLQLRNAGAETVKLTVATPLSAAGFELAPGRQLLLELDLPPEGRMPVAVDYPVGASVAAGLLP